MNNDNVLLTCCHLETGPCTKAAQWEIKPEGSVYEHYHACDEHLAGLLGEGVNQVWSVGT